MTQQHHVAEQLAAAADGLQPSDVISRTCHIVGLTVQLKIKTFGELHAMVGMLLLGLSTADIHTVTVELSSS